MRRAKFSKDNDMTGGIALTMLIYYTKPDYRV